MDAEFYIEPSELAACRSLTGNDKVVYAVLRYRAGKNMTCWPGARSLAQDAGGSERYRGHDKLADQEKHDEIQSTRNSD